MFKFVIAIVGCLLFRLIPLPFRAPNVEPILATAMPFAKKYGGVSGFMFGFASILLFDFATGTGGAWTFVTSVTYGAIGWGSALFLANKSSIFRYGAYAVAGTIFYDVVTGVLMGPILFGQPFAVALAGQVPFTLMHLAGNVTLAVLISPLIERWVYARPVFSMDAVYDIWRTPRNSREHLPSQDVIS